MKLCLLLFLVVSLRSYADDNASKLPKSGMFPDGKSVQVAVRGITLSTSDAEFPREVSMEEHWSFVEPATRKLMLKMVTRENYRAPIKEDVYARITRRERLLTIELVRIDGSVLAVHDIEARVVKEKPDEVFRYAQKSVQTGDHPAIHESEQEDYFVTESGDFLVRGHWSNWAWLFYKLGRARGDYVFLFKKWPNKTVEPTTTAVMPRADQSEME